MARMAAALKFTLHFQGARVGDKPANENPGFLNYGDVMIISASYRTDIPAFYARWFINRLKAGSVRVRNPYGGKDSDISLRPADVSGYVFWTKNLAPFTQALALVRGQGVPFVVQYSINAYPRALERAVTDARRAAAHMHDLAQKDGPRVAVWRYDPIVITSLTDAEWHVENFAKLAGMLKGSTDEVTTSFCEPYRKTHRNMDAAAKAEGFTWTPEPDDALKRALLDRLAAIATDHGMKLTLCTQPALVTDAIPGAACIDAARLSDVAGHDVTAKQKGNRPGCLCAQSRDIGAYDTCPHGCVYCYAVNNHKAAKQKFRGHDEDSEILG